MFPVNLWLLTRVLFFAHAAAGALGTRSSLRPLIYQGHIFMHSSGESRREDAEPRSPEIRCANFDLSPRRAGRGDSQGASRLAL